MSKGDKVYIEGRIKTRKWQDDKGNDRYSTEIHCTDFTFLTAKDENTTGNTSAQQMPQAQNTQQQVNGPTNDNDDLPF